MTSRSPFLFFLLLLSNFRTNAPHTPSLAESPEKAPDGKRGKHVEEMESDDEDLDLRDGLVVGGYHDLVVATAAEDIPEECIRLSTPTASVVVRDGPGESDADGEYRCVVTSTSGASACSLNSTA